MAREEADKAVVLFDGGCAFCQRSVALLKRLDWFGQLTYQDACDVAQWPKCHERLDSAKLLEQLHVVTPDRRHAPAGFRAFRWLAWRLPLFWPIAPLLYLPGVLGLGNRFYRWVAKNRYGIIPCEGGVCQLPKRAS